MKTYNTLFKNVLIFFALFTIGINGSNAQGLLSLKFYIQDYYLGSGLMSTPLFNSGLSNNSDEVGTCTVELIDPISCTPAESIQGILKSNGTLEIPFSSPIGNYYFIKISHHNTIQTYTSGQILLSAITSYDFSLSQLNAYGNNMIAVEPNVWAFYSGDINQDCIIDAMDLNILNNGIAQFIFGYDPSDLNGDGFVDMNDFVLMDAHLSNPVNCQSPCSQTPACSIFGDDYSSNLGWTQVGSAITVNSLTAGQVHFEEVPGNSDHRVYKNIGLLTNTWMVEFDAAPNGGSNAGVSAMLMCLSAGSDIPYRVTPTGAYTNQNHIAVEIASPPNTPDYTTSSYFYVSFKNDANAPLLSSFIPVPAWNVRYYFRLERFDAGSGLLSIFSDPLRRNHIAGSPICLNINGKITGLNTLQHANVNQAGSARRFTGDLDNTCISSTPSNALTFSINSTENATCATGGCFHLSYSGLGPFTFFYDYVNPNDPQTIYTSPQSSSDAIFCNLPPGQYALVIRDACGNYKTIFGDILGTTGPVANAGPDIAICDLITNIPLIGSPSVPGAIYSWTSLDGGSVLSGQATFSITVSGLGCYQLVVIDPATNCSDTDTVCVVLRCPAEALDFDGVDDYISLGNNPQLKPSGGLTAEIWLHQGNWAAVPEKTILGNTQNGGYSLEFDAGNLLSAWVYRNGSYGIANYNCSGLNPGWHHLAMTFDGSDIKLFVDGIVVATNISGTTGLIEYSSYSNSTLVGAEAFEADTPEPDTYCPGKLDDLRIWDYARNCNEINSDKNCELLGTETGLLAYYKFNQGIDAGANPLVNQPFDSKTNSYLGELRSFSLDGPASNWIAPGAVSTGTTCSGLLSYAEINIQGNNLSIADGDITPDLNDFTDFGNVPFNATITHTFYIQNTGNAPLEINNITLTGPDAGLFSIGTLILSSPIQPGSSAIFSVSFTTSSPGLKSALIHVSNFDCDESDYYFAIQVTGQGCCTNNFIQNPGFTNGLNISGNIGGGSTLDNWTYAYGSPQIIVAPGCEDNGYVRMWGNKFSAESIQQILSTQILQGHKYRLCFCARWNNLSTPPTADQFVRFMFRASNGTLLDNSPTLPVLGTVARSVIGTSINITNTGTWVTYELGDWTADADYSRITISVTNDSPSDHGNFVSWGEIDNVCLSLSPCDNFPQVDAGPDQTICAGSCATLSSPAYQGTTIGWYELPNYNFIGNSLSATVCPTQNTCYALIASGAFGCADTDEVCIVLSDLTVSCNKTDVTCNGLNNGSVCATIQCGTAPYLYTLQVGGGSGTAQASPCMSNLAPGEYCVLVTDAMGNSASCCFTITEPGPVIADAGPDQTICGNGSATLAALGTGVTRAWYRLPGHNLIASGSPIVVSPTTSTCYELIETDQNGCTSSDIVCVSKNLPPIAEWPISFAEICEDASPFLLTGGMPSNSVNAGIVILPGEYSGDAVLFGSFSPGLAQHKQNVVYYTVTNECGSSVVSNIVTVINCPCDNCHEESNDQIVNGDFENGTFGFTSDYSTNPNLPGGYQITWAPSFVNSGFSSCSDHTGIGDMMVVNGSTNTFSLPFWNETVQIQKHKNYTLTFYATNLGMQSPPQISAKFTNQSGIYFLGNVFTSQNLIPSTTNCQWTKFEVDWYSGNYNGSMLISLVDNNNSNSGNDFAIDDISFVGCESNLEVTWPISFTPICNSSPIFLLSGGEPAGGSYSGPGIMQDFNSTGYILNPSALSIGTHEIFYIYYDAQTNCVDTAFNTITLIDPPAITISGPQAVCTNDPAFTLIPSIPGGTFSCYPGSPFLTAGGVFTPSLAGYGYYGIQYTYVYAPGCTTTAYISFYVINCGVCGLCYTLGSEMIRNGGFENGYSFLQTDLSYTQNMCTQENVYRITEDADGECNRFYNTRHNNSDDHFLINAKRYSTKKAWYQSINVKKGRTYNVKLSIIMGLQDDYSTAGFFATLGTHNYWNSDNSHPDLSVQIGNDIPLKIPGSSLSDNSWRDYAFNWTSPKDGNVTLIIWQNTSSGGHQYVYALDNISVKECRPNVVVNLGADKEICMGTGTTLTANTTGTLSGGNLRYKWQPGGQTTQSITVGPNSTTTYTVTVTDYLGCSDTKTIVVKVVNLKGQRQNVVCSSDENGSIDLEVCAGTPPYTYAWSNGATTSSISNLSIGNYTVTVTDFNGISFSGSFDIEGPEPINPMVVITDASGIDSTGFISTNTVGGTAPYSYMWNDGSTEPFLSNRPPGHYTVSISDTNGCTSGPTTFSILSTTCITDCCGPNTTTIDLLRDNFESVPHPIQSDLTLNRVCANGTYLISENAKDKCNSFRSVTDHTSGIGKFLIIEGSSSQVNQKVYKQMIPVVSGGQYIIFAYYNFNLDSTGNDTLISFLLNDRVVWSPVSGCITSAGIADNGWVLMDFCYTADTTGMIELAMIQHNTGGAWGIDDITVLKCVDFSPPVITSTRNSEVCPGGVMPQFTVTYSTIYPPGDVHWWDGFVGPTRTGLSPGVYPFAVRDSIGFITIDSLVVTEAAPIQVTASINNACPNSVVGSIQLQISGGNAPYSYLWSNGATTQNIFGLDAGSFSVIVGDNNGCNASSSYSINWHGTCLGSCPCNLELFSETDFTHPLIITTVQSDLVQSSICGIGTYKIGLNAQDKCPSLSSVNDFPTGNEHFMIAEGFLPNSLSKKIWFDHFTVEAGRSYYISADYYLKIDPTAEPLQFKYVADGVSSDPFDSASFHDDGYAVNQWHRVGMCLTATSDGTIEISIQQLNSGGAFGIDNIRWWECPRNPDLIPIPVIPRFGDVGIPCPGLNNGSIRANFWFTIPGDPIEYPVDPLNPGGWSWLWNTGATTNIIYNASPGLYTVTLTSPTGLTASSTYLLEENPPIVITINSVQNITCHGGEDGSFNFNASGGTQPFTYVVERINGLGCCTSGNCGRNSLFSCQSCKCLSIVPGIYSDLDASQYVITVTDANGCMATQTITLTEPPAITLNSSFTAIQCFGGSTCVNINASGGTAPYSGTGSFCGIGEGTTNFSVTDDNGCVANTSVIVTEPAKIEATFIVTPATCTASNGSLITNASGGTAPYEYSLNGVFYQTANNFGSLASDTYIIRIRDARGCLGAATVQVPTSGAMPNYPDPITGPAGACRNQNNIVFSIPPLSGADEYIWILPNGATGSSTGTSISVNFGPNFQGGFICVRAKNACGISMSTCFNIPVFTVKPGQPDFINGNPHPCGPNIYYYSIPNVTNAGSYNWSVTGTGVAILTGNGGNTVAVSIPAGFGQGSISVNVSNCIGTSSTRTLTLSGIPIHGNALNGPGYVCANTNGVPYYINMVLGTNGYVWTTTGDMSIASSNGPACTVNFGPNFTTGTLEVTTSSSCGSFVKSYTIKSVPGQPGSISGPGYNLCGQNGVTYSIALITSATSYIWTVPPGATITNNTGASITVDFSTSFTTSGNICVTAVSVCGSSTARCYLVSAAPAPPSTINGSVSVCQSAAAITYSVSPVAGSIYYSWYATNGATVSPQGNGLTAIVDFTSSTASPVSVRAKSNNNCNYSGLASKSVAVNFSCREGGRPDQLESETFYVYPNPTHGKVQIDYMLTNKKDCIFTIIDLLGNSVDQYHLDGENGMNTADIDLSNLNKGMYFIVLEQNGKEIQKQKIILQ